MGAAARHRAVISAGADRAGLRSASLGRRLARQGGQGLREARFVDVGIRPEVKEAILGLRMRAQFIDEVAQPADRQAPRLESGAELEESRAEVAVFLDENAGVALGGVEQSGDQGGLLRIEMPEQAPLELAPAPRRLRAVVRGETLDERLDGRLESSVIGKEAIANSGRGGKRRLHGPFL